MKIKKTVFLSLLIYAIMLTSPLLFLKKSESLQHFLGFAIYLIGCFSIIFVHFFILPKSPFETNRSAKPLQILFLGVVGAGLAIISQILMNLLITKYSGAGIQSENTQLILASLKQYPYEMITIAFLAPITEEFIFRRSLSSLFTLKIPKWISIFFSSALFSLAHFDGYFFIYFTLGIIFSWVYWRSGNITTSIISHCLMNFIVILPVITPLFYH